MSDDPRISAVQDKMRDAVHAGELNSEQAINCAAEFLVLVVLSSVQEEKHAHEIMNQATEHAHLYINENWKKTAELHAQRNQQVVQSLFSKVFRR